ncbi:MAG: DUF1127 domain-containing protein [Pseudolabrys sp.]
MLYFIAAAAKRLVHVIARSCRRRAARDLLRLDAHMLRDIGLSRYDVVQCLSAPRDERDA